MVAVIFNFSLRAARDQAWRAAVRLAAESESMRRDDLAVSRRAGRRARVHGDAARRRRRLAGPAPTPARDARPRTGDPGAARPVGLNARQSSSAGDLTELGADRRDVVVVRATAPAQHGELREVGAQVRDSPAPARRGRRRRASRPRRARRGSSSTRSPGSRGSVRPRAARGRACARSGSDGRS